MRFGRVCACVSAALPAFLHSNLLCTSSLPHLQLLLLLFLSFDSDVLYVAVGCLYVFEVCVIMYARAFVYLSLRVMCVSSEKAELDGRQSARFSNDNLIFDSSRS